MSHLRWTQKAAEDLDSIYTFIERESARYARLTVAGIVRVARSAAEKPLLGRVVPEFGRTDIRERFYRQYIIVYRLITAGIEVLTVSHTSRLLR